MDKLITASYIIIGDEILSGRTVEANLNFLAKSLGEIGVFLKEVRVVGDDEEQIISAVKELKTKYDYLFTSGGVGPTHDDITSFCVAKALGLKLQKDDHAAKLLEEHYGKENVNESRMKMAFIPEGARMVDNHLMAIGGFYIDNIFVLAGVPKIFQSMFFGIKDKIKGGKTIKSVEISTELKEGDFAKELGELQKKYCDVIIGSYPFEKGVNLVFKSFDNELLEGAINEAREFIKTITLCKKG